MLHGVKLISIDSNATEKNYHNAHNIIGRGQYTMNETTIMGLRRAMECSGGVAHPELMQIEAGTSNKTLSIKKSK